MGKRIRWFRAIVEPMVGFAAVSLTVNQLTFWYGRRADLNESIWNNYGCDGMFLLSLLNGLWLFFFGPHSGSRAVTAFCILIMARWWLHPWGLFPFRAPFYFMVCVFWLMWPHWVLRNDRLQLETSGEQETGFSRQPEADE